MDDKAQISLEAVLILGVSVLVILSIFNIWWARMSFARDVGEAGEAKMVGVLLAEAINNAYANGGNFSITLTSEEINFTRLGDTSSMEGGGMALPIVIDRAQRRINISKDMSKTGGSTWNTTVSIIPSDIVMNTSPDYLETTILNNGSHIIIYASNSHITVVP
ncbi:MAG: hypothetical protein ACE5HH_05560 [Candidatus Hydrothermarchaeales archaeon]